MLWKETAFPRWAAIIIIIIIIIIIKIAHDYSDALSRTKRYRALYNVSKQQMR